MKINRRQFNFALSLFPVLGKFVTPKVRVVHVVAWESEGCCGFDWYWDKTEADAAWEEEKKNCRRYATYGWVAVRYEHRPAAIEPDDITSEIESQCVEFFDAATERFAYKDTQ